MSIPMKRSLLAASLLLAVPLSAAEHYLPLGGRTRATLTNTSPAPTTITIDLLGSRMASRTLQLDAGATTRWEHSGTGAARIFSADAIAVTATRTCASCEASSRVPLFDRRNLLDEGTIAAGSAAGWESGIGMVNPESTPVRVTLSAYDGETLVDQKSVRVAARGVRLMQAFPRATRVTFTAPHDVLLFRTDANQRSGAQFFRAAKPVVEAGQPRRRAVRFTSSLPPAQPQTVVLTPSKDNTLFQTSNGSSSNGRGEHLFAGATGSRSIRRAVLAFDIAAQIPPGSRVSRASLTVTVSRAISEDAPMTLHRVTADWGEGTSNAGSFRDGNGDGSTPGDATWVHTFFPNQRWAAPGGDFAAAADANGIAGSFGPATFASSETMIARVQEWLDQPASNFGWMVRVDENDSGSAKQLISREGPEAERPQLTIEFTP
jgi:hypothetical protein